MIFGVFSPAGCSSKDDIPGSPSGGDKTPGGGENPGGGETPISMLDLPCPTGTARLAGTSKKTTDTCTIDTKIDTDGDGIPDFTDVDDDGDGLIEIDSLLMLHNIRHNLDGTGYKAPDDNRDATGDKTGCGKTGSVVCNGYELTQDLSFDKDGDGETWSGDSSSGYTLDPEDNASPYFIVADGGWKPIGEATIASNNVLNCNNLCFNAIFEGNGHTITGLAISREEQFIGMFDSTTMNAAIRNIGLNNNLANCTRTSGPNYIGGLVGSLSSSGSITASYARGAVNGGAGSDSIGGLVGSLSGSGSITASYARGPVNGGAGNDSLGGLVGNLSGRGSITASYARGPVNGGAGNDFVGGLIGFLGSSNGKLIASYATGDVDGGSGSSDRVGGLIGFLGTGVMIIDNYDFGTAINGTIDNTAGATYPGGVSSATDLTLMRAPSSWDELTKNTKGAWNFGSSSETPALQYADYDGTGNKYYCDNVDAPTPTTGTPIPIPNCGTLIPGQR